MSKTDLIRSEQAFSHPQCSGERLEPASERPGPASEKPEPTTKRPKPAFERPEPVSERPEPGPKRSEPASERPGPASEGQPYGKTGVQIAPVFYKTLSPLVPSGAAAQKISSKQF